MHIQTLFHLQWVLGNYSQSYQRMLAIQTEPFLNKHVLSSHQDAFLDPSIGQYCLMLTMKTSMRNAVGEKNAAVLGRWAILMCATALSRCGLPVSSHFLLFCPILTILKWDFASI